MEFYLVLGVEFCGVSIGMLFLQVLVASVHLSHGGAVGGQSLAVMVGSLANAFGRFSMGVLSDKTLRAVKRTTWGVPMFWLMALGYLLVILVPQPEVVIAGAALIGFAYGGLAGGLVPTLVADIWGTKFFGINYGIIQAMNPLGFLVWGQVYGAIYDWFLPEGYSETACLGRVCTLYGMIFMLILVLVAFGLNVLLHYKLPPVWMPQVEDVQFVELKDDRRTSMSAAALSKLASLPGK